MRKAFTLIELMVSIAILSIIMLFLYKTYAQLNISNKIYASKVQEMQKYERIKKSLYLDLSVAKFGTVQTLNQDKKVDIVFMQTSHSLYKRVMPNVAYVVKEKKLYRLESLEPFKEYPLVADSNFVSEFLGEVEIFRLYKSNEANTELYLLHAEFKEYGEILLKIKLFNEL